MIALLQRVAQAHVEVGGEVVGRIDAGLLAFIAVERGDTETQSQRLLEKILGYRLFADAQGKMNLSVRDVRGGLLLVSQFTLAADTRKGLRPSFTPAAPPDEGLRLFDHLVALARREHHEVATGAYGADMQVHLVNDGPVTIWLRTQAQAEHCLT